MSQADSATADPSADTYPVHRKKLAYSLGRLSSSAFLHGFYRLKIEGIEHIPKTGPFLLASNHQSFLDPPAVGVGVLDRQLVFLARAGLFKNKFFGAMIRSFNSVPVAEGGKSDTAAIRAILGALAEGQGVVLFPEGERTADGTVGEFKRGIAVLLKKANCPVVPAAIEGAFDAWPRTRKLPKLFGQRVAVKYAPPIQAADILKPDAASGLVALRNQIDTMRAELRAELRARSKGRFPLPGPADG